MKIQDIELLERIAAKYKYKYDLLDTCFNSSVINSIIYVPINVTVLLSELKQYGESIDDSKDFNLHCAITIMNLFAHFKHYYTSRQVSHIVIIGFVKDSFCYKQYKGVITIIEGLCEFFPNIYFMGDIAPMKHSILVASYVNYLHSVTASSECSVHIYSSLNIDKQLLCLLPSKETYKICKPMNNQSVEFLSKNQFLNKLFKNNEEAFKLVHSFKPEIEKLCVLIGVFLNTYECYSASEKTHFTFSFIRENTLKRASHILEFLSQHYKSNDKENNINSQFIKFLESYLVNKVDIESLKKYVNRYDYYSHEGRYMYKFMRELHNTNRIKLKDYEISKETEKYRLLIEHQLYANWLLF
jgi:hypothetical protein